MVCPTCNSERIVKNGHIHNGKQNHLCKDCGRQFVEIRTQKQITDYQKQLVVRLLLERISLRGICRVMGITMVRLLDFFRDITDEIPEYMGAVLPEKGCLTLEPDEMRSFVGNKENKKWIWLAVDRDTKQIAGFHIGGRSEQDAEQLWNSLPGVYRQCAVCYSDFWQAYKSVIPECRHRPVGKESGQTNHIERTNCTLRQRISRLVRKTLSFSRKKENHIRAIRYFIWNYNLSLLV